MNEGVPRWQLEDILWWARYAASLGNKVRIELRIDPKRPWLGHSSITLTLARPVKKIELNIVV